jgi:serine/threonine protein kinase
MVPALRLSSFSATKEALSESSIFEHAAVAEDARIGQQVAIKVIRSEGIAYPQRERAKEAARLFEREAKAIARLDHPNILPL